MRHTSEFVNRSIVLHSQVEIGNGTTVTAWVRRGEDGLFSVLTADGPLDADGQREADALEARVRDASRSRLIDEAGAPFGARSPRPRILKRQRDPSPGSRFYVQANAPESVDHVDALEGVQGEALLKGSHGSTRGR